MGEPFQLPIPIWRAQYQLLGGHRRMLGILVIYVAAGVVGIVGMRRVMDDIPWASYAGGVLNFLAAIQAILIVLGGASAIHRATTRDFQTKMIESHRLTPMSNIAVVLGYSFGATCQMLMLFVINVAVGAVLTLTGPFPIPDWLLGNFLLLTSAVMVWSVTVFGGVRLEKPLAPAPFLIIVGALMVPLSMLPGAGLMAGIYSVVVAMEVLLARAPASLPAMLGLATLNIVLTVYWMACASAKYRRPDLPALGASRGLTLLGLWLLVATSGLVVYPALTRTGFVAAAGRVETEHQWVATLIVALLVALVPINGAVDCQRLVRRGTSVRGRMDRVSDLTITMIAVLMIAVLPPTLLHFVWQGEAFPFESTLDGSVLRGIACTAFVCALALLTLRSVLVLAYTWLKAPTVVTAVFVLLAWGGPVAVDAIRAVTVAEYNSGVRYSWILTCSPAGAITAIWTLPGPPLVPGIAIQAVIAGLFLYLALPGDRGAPPMQNS